MTPPPLRPSWVRSACPCSLRVRNWSMKRLRYAENQITILPKQAEDGSIAREMFGKTGFVTATFHAWRLVRMRYGPWTSSTTHSRWANAAHPWGDRHLLTILSGYRVAAQLPAPGHRYRCSTERAIRRRSTSTKAASSLRAIWIYGRTPAASRSFPDPPRCWINDPATS